jgi:hypothetical protein
MTRIKPEWYSSRTNKKLHARSARRHLVHQMIHPCCFPVMPASTYRNARHRYPKTEKGRKA